MIRRRLEAVASRLAALWGRIRPEPGTPEGPLTFGLLLLAAGFLAAGLIPLALGVTGAILVAISLGFTFRRGG